MSARPNILLVLLDNVGYGDPGCYGGGITRRAPTSRIDRLAGEGLRLTNFNVEAECTPTRAALMTGRMPVRTGCQRVNPPGLRSGLAPWERTMAAMLEEVGYRTAIYGKWHLGNTPDRHPTALGFEEWFGIQPEDARGRADAAHRSCVARSAEVAAQAAEAGACQTAASRLSGEAPALPQRTASRPERGIAWADSVVHSERRMPAMGANDLR